MKHYLDKEFKHKEKLKQELLDKLDLFWDILNTPKKISAVIVTSDYSEGGHTTNSEHYTGEACDVSISCDLMKGYSAARKAGFINIGLYPKFKGLHLGIRKHQDLTERRSWIGLGVDKNQRYVPFTQANIKKYIGGL